MSAPNLREAIAEARRLGAQVEHVRRTGEKRITGPGGKCVVVSARRQSASRALVGLLWRLRRARGKA